MSETTQSPGPAAPWTARAAADEPPARPSLTVPRSGPGSPGAPAGLYKTTIVIWSPYPGDRTELSHLARQAEAGDAYCPAYRSAFIPVPAADPDWDGTDFFGPASDSVLLLCDSCYQAATGLLAECEDGCFQDLDHTGLCLQPGADECQWCGCPDRLHIVSRADVADQLPAVGERDEGQWFLSWPDGQRGPYPSAQAAWDDWHASPVTRTAKQRRRHEPRHPAFPASRRQDSAHLRRNRVRPGRPVPGHRRRAAPIRPGP